MAQPAEKLVDEDLSLERLSAKVAYIIERQLKPLTVKIDLEGVYPQDVLRQLGSAGVFQQHLPSMRADGQQEMGGTIELMATVSHECLSTGFAVWCQDTCAWYIENADNQGLKDQWLAKVASGRVLAGTGMSNTMKAFADIEPLRLHGRRVDGGYIVNGSLPWVSNLGRTHVFGTLFALDGDQGKPVMALVDCGHEAFELRCAAHFTALEGTRTFACIFKEVFIADDMIIDHDGAAFLKRVRSGMILLQSGMAIGNIQSCIDIGRAVESRLGHVNQYLDDRPKELQQELDDVTDAGLALAEDPFETSVEYFKAVLQLRLTASELALRASQSAMLHAGASGYLNTAPAQRKLRESYFVAIVTPAIKHLRRQLDLLAA